MTNTFSRLKLKYVLIISISVILYNCKKEKNIIGAELQDSDISVNQLSNFKLNTYIKESDSLKSDELSVSTLGSYVDPVLGKTDAGFYTQIRLSSDNVNFFPTGVLTDIVLDSVVFAIQIKDFYGDLTPQTFEIYEIAEEIIKDSSYYTSSSFSSMLMNLVKPGTETITPNPTSKVLVGNDSLPAQLRINLSKTFGQKIIDESGNTTLSDNDNFSQFINGLYVKVNNASQISGEGAILLLDLLSKNSKITLYYKDTAKSDTLTFDLLLNSFCARVNKVTHDYTGTLVQSQFMDSTLGKTNVYIQGLAGITTQIELTDIMNLKDSNIIINKAVLSLPVDFSTGSALEPNTQLLILRNENEEKFLLPDQTQYSGQGGLDNVGGKWNEDDKQYEFIITRYVNNLLNGNLPNNRLSIETTSSLVTPNRAVIYGSESIIKKPKLTITYTKY